MMDKEQKFGDVLKGLTSSKEWQGKLHETKIREVWNEKMGTTINHYTTSIKLRNEKLFINIEASSLKQELSYEREKIKTMMNSELGGEFVKDVIIR